MSKRNDGEHKNRYQGVHWAQEVLVGCNVVRSPLYGRRAGTRVIDEAHENVLILRQQITLLQDLDDATYRCDVAAMMMSSVGAHVRHNLDHYQRFFVGLDTGVVDYDARQREKVLEIDRLAALTATRSICGRLAELTQVQGAANLRVCCNRDQGTQQATSSVIRELDFLRSHTVHHYAIIAVLCRIQNVAVAQNFGVAPSTLRYRAELATTEIRATPETMSTDVLDETPASRSRRR